MSVLRAEIIPILIAFGAGLAIGFGWGVTSAINAWRRNTGQRLFPWEKP